MFTNPIKKINGVDVSKIPSSWAQSENDVSAPNAGRDEAGFMHKQKLGASSKYEMEFSNVRSSVVHDLTNLVKSTEYLTVEVADIVDGDPANNYIVTKVVYVGDRTMGLYNSSLDVWSSLTFNLIERGIH